MLRWVAYTLSVICGLLLLATIVLWVRSYRYEEGAYYDGARDVSFCSTRGMLRITVSHRLGYKQADNWSLWSRRATAIVGAGKSRIRELDYPTQSFLLVWRPNPPASSTWQPVDGPMEQAPSDINLMLALGIPHWLLVLTFALPLAIWTIRFERRRRRRVAGLCHVCGYDLRATPERCPECGAVPRTAELGAREHG